MTTITNTSTTSRSNISHANPSQVLPSGVPATHSPELLAFTNPHPVDQHDIQFDLSRRRKGVCKFFNSHKGFGFINDDHPEELGNQEVFVHYTSIESKGNFRSLAEGEEVEYVVAPGQKGFQATDVTGPAGRAVQGDVKSKLPKTPAFVPYPMGIMPAASAYALAGAGSPYIQPDPYMAAGAYPTPYPGQVFYLPSPVGVLAGGHSPNLTAMSPYGSATSPHPSIRTPTVPFSHHQHGAVAMTLSPQPVAGGFGFASPSMAYGFAGSPGSGVLPGTITGVGNGVSEMRSPRIVGAGSGGSRAQLVGSAGFGTEQIHNRTGPVGGTGGQSHQLGGFQNGSGSGGSLLYTTSNGVHTNHQ